ncbi:MAG: hypothetical protein CSA60_01675 [Neptuniibacter caesariensis]|uniref:DUF3301 domain-containing protein n=1 Tax=Neptuniibacter caesariensis TaxID=207954 RepID=A0A2G6JNQ7_NEPCE|nr:MAG: hypothetical protein CSA60_01675 [Neptuniibacter caesariensis]
MYIDLEALFVVTLLIFLCYHWWQSQKVKEVALNYTRRQCKALGLQLLDDNINLRGFWLRRDKNGQVRVWRSFNFEFSSTGDERYSGNIITLGRNVTDLHLQPHRLE